MKAAAFEYLCARDVDQAVSALARHGVSAKLISGGQSLVPMLNLRLVRPALLIDISRIERLHRFDQMADIWRFGGAVTHAQIEDAAGMLPGVEMMAEVAAGIAYRSVRNCGTIGGSLAHADPAADWPLALAALDATVTTRGPDGKSRRISAESFMRSAFTTELHDDEVIEYVDVPKLSVGARYGYCKFCRKTGEFPEASAAVVLDPERKVSRIFVGALHGAPKLLASLSRTVAEHGVETATRDAVNEAIRTVAPELDVLERRTHTAVVLRTLTRAVSS